MKPATLLRQEFIDAEAKLINESGLPAFVLIDVLERTLSVLRELDKQQYEADKAKWEEEQQNADTRSEHESTD